VRTTGSVKVHRGHGSVIAVTTRARIRDVRSLFPALSATARIRRELTAVPACLRFDTMLAGRRELLTVSVWTSHQDVLEFIGSGAHSPMVWSRPGWLTSYWGMRWRPGGAEIGSWDGDTVRNLTLADPEASRGDPPASATQDRGPPAAEGQPRGRPPPGFNSSTLPAALRSDLDGALGTMYRLDPQGWRAPAALRDMRRLQRQLNRHPAVFACAGGITPHGQMHLLVTWNDMEAARQFASAAEHSDFMHRWAGRVWWMEWLPEGETGQWDGRRLREQRLGGLAARPAVLDLKLQPTFDAPSRARAAFGGLHLDVQEHILDDARLLLSELVTNGVRHAGLEPHEWIRVRVQTGGGSIRVEVADPGPGFQAPAAETRDLTDASGRGLLLLQQLPDRWGIVTDGLTRVWFEFHSSPPAPAGGNW
jgi:anti-sigma regulatory factor (Ser/Thr protein kinase)